MSRVWAMPNCDTFSIAPIRSFVGRYVRGVIVDPFARNSRIATHTNDLNPETTATFHMEALDFLRHLKAEGILCDVLLFDPPYSVRQVSECYAQVGHKTVMADTQCNVWTEWKRAIAEICAPGATVLSFGWNTVGMGKKHGFRIEEILLVCHGGIHNDTICVAERKGKGLFG